MTRIIAGFAGSREIAVPKSGTRPTSDRVREAIFSALDARDAIVDARVLDLFAGSGALGLESLSRGAASVVLVEKNPKAAEIAGTNAAVVRSVGVATGAQLPMSAVQVVTNSVEHYLAGLAGPHMSDSGNATNLFDLAFIDPPYDLPDAELDVVLERLTAHLLPNADVIVERSSRSRPPTAPIGMTLDKSKAYGETTIHWFRRDEFE